ncbi:hypothetical protein BGX24_005530 [Mortierella sp. AD032]|nr:hypothetical protein BGX24_005530 [Mortierella sp. AD032]
MPPKKTPSGAQSKKTTDSSKAPTARKAKTAKTSGSGPILKFVAVTPKPKSKKNATARSVTDNKTDDEELNFRVQFLPWLEVPFNFGFVYGFKTPPVGVIMGTKEQNWERAAVELNLLLGTSMVGEHVRLRALHYRKAYFAAADSCKKTGAGVLSDGGADNFDEELMTACYGFDRMHTLFWNNPHLRPAYEASTGFEGLIKFSSREMQYIVSDSSAGGNSGGGSAVVVEDACEHEDRQEDLQELEYGENEESGSENDENKEFGDDQGSEYQDLDQAIPYQGEAFSHSRAPRPPQSDSDKTKSISTSNPKRRRSADRSTASRNSSTPTASSVRQRPPASLSSSNHYLDQQLDNLLNIANPAKLVTL